MYAALQPRGAGPAPHLWPGWPGRSSCGPTGRGTHAGSANTEAHPPTRVPVHLLSLVLCPVRSSSSTGVQGCSAFLVSTGPGQRDRPTSLACSAMSSTASSTSCLAASLWCALIESGATVLACSPETLVFSCVSRALPTTRWYQIRCCHVLFSATPLFLYPLSADNPFGLYVSTWGTVAARLRRGALALMTGY